MTSVKFVNQIKYIVLPHALLNDDMTRRDKWNHSTVQQTNSGGPLLSILLQLKTLFYAICMLVHAWKLWCRYPQPSTKHICVF